MKVPCLQTITFDSASHDPVSRVDPMRPVWEVTMNEDGSLTIIPTGRRAGKILVEPQSQNCIKVTTTKIKV